MNSSNASSSTLPSSSSSSSSPSSSSSFPSFPSSSSASDILASFSIPPPPPSLGSLPALLYPNFSSSSSSSSSLPSGDVAVQAAANAVSVDFSVYIDVLMGVLMTASFLLNLGLVVSVASDAKLRRSLLYLMFCVLALLNMFDVLAIMFLSMLCVSDAGQWIFGHFLCRLNAFAQQFVFLASLLFLSLSSLERALLLLGPHLVSFRFFGLLSLLFLLVPLCFASPLFLHGFPVSVYPFRYLCAIGDGSSVYYSVCQLLIYGGCLFVLLLCFGAILRHKNMERTLPVKPQDYGAFIKESRALEEHMNLSRAVLFLTVEFLIIQGPYICMDFFMQIRNSAELIRRFGTPFLMPQDVDTLITLVKLFHPLFVPVLIFAFCADIWTRFIGLLCCRRPSHDPALPLNMWPSRPSLTDRRGSSSGAAVHPGGADNVLTVFATAEGLQLRIPQPQQQQRARGMTAIGSPEPERMGMKGMEGRKGRKKNGGGGGKMKMMRRRAEGRETEREKMEGGGR